MSGVLALLVDIGVLYAPKDGLGDYVGRGVSFLCAATFTWAFNRRLTFQTGAHDGLVAEYLAYLSSMAVGGVINYGVYAVSLAGSDLSETASGFGRGPG